MTLLSALDSFTTRASLKTATIIIISAKWTKWMAEIMCSFNECLCFCLCVRSGPVNQTSLKWELNANSSKTVKATDFKFDTHVPRDSLDTTPKIFSKRGRCQGHVTSKFDVAPVSPNTCPAKYKGKASHPGEAPPGEWMQ